MSILGENIVSAYGSYDHFSVFHTLFSSFVTMSSSKTNWCWKSEQMDTECSPAP